MAHGVFGGLAGIARLGMHGSCDLIDIVAQPGQISFQLRKFRRQTGSYRLKEKSLACELAEGQSGLLGISTNLFALLFAYAKNDALCFRIGLGLSSPL
jgi:hypothetical protein